MGRLQSACQPEPRPGNEVGDDRDCDLGREWTARTFNAMAATGIARTRGPGPKRGRVPTASTGQAAKVTGEGNAAGEDCRSAGGTHSSQG